jgi:hypothetical protein
MPESGELPQKAVPEARSKAQALVFSVRVLLLVSAAIAGMVALAVTFAGRSVEAESAQYVCPMHPDVRSASPNQCPICGMALERSERGPATLRSGSRVNMPGMADLTAVENVRKHKVLDFVRLHSLPIDVRELRAAAWVEPDLRISAAFYADQASVITPMDEASFTPTEAPESSFAVQLSSDQKPAWDRSLVQLHFDSKKSVGGKRPSRLIPGQVGWLEVPRKPRSVLAVPANAILQAPEGPYVLRALGGFRFEKRSIEIAETFSKQGFAVVLSGLRAQDRVVARAAFFLDADRRLENRSAAGDQVEF